MANAQCGWLVLLWIALLSGCQSKQRAQQEYPYLIVADIEGCDSCQAKLYINDYSTLQDIDTVVAPRGQFSLRGTITQPGLYTLYYFSRVNKTVSGLVQVYLPTDSIHITNTGQPIRTKFYQQPEAGSYLQNTIVFSTSPRQQQWEQYLVLQDSLWHQYFVDKAVVVAKFSETFRSGNKALIEQWADSARSFDYRAASYWAAAAELFVRRYPASEVSLWAMLENRHDLPSAARFRQHYQAMPTQLQQSFYGQLLNKALATSESRNQKNQRFVGRRIERLAGKTPAGKELNSKQLFQRNKLTLVEFWASWCGPCRMEMPKYYGLYKQYKTKGFGLVGVSLDQDYNKWVKAIAEDSLRIPHLSELQGTHGEDIQRFAITGIPANLLVDSTGRIVAVDVSFPKLHKKLQHAF
ncbi:TlpA disulfide reductase family protein [Hymenobacter setariae]|nr:TlpA disulfide reductase family protein [Hymenobacter setariae]